MKKLSIVVISPSINTTYANVLKESIQLTRIGLTFNPIDCFNKEQKVTTNSTYIIEEQI